MISVRAYQPSDFHAVHDVITSCAAQDRTRRLSENALRRALAPDHTAPLDALVANVDGNVAGLIWWDSGRTEMRVEGWVRPETRRKGVGTALMIAAERHARQFTVCSALTGRGYEDIPGVDALYKLRGFTMERQFYVMSTALGGRDFDPASSDIPDVVSFRAFHVEDLDALVEADNEIFADHWGSSRRSVQAWQRDMIEMRPHDPGLWIVAWIGDDIVGECLCHASREGGPNDAWVSIVGVRHEWRGRGLGRALLARGLKELQKAGFERAGLNVDSENHAAINLYRSLEMDVVRQRLHYRKMLRR